MTDLLTDESQINLGAIESDSANMAENQANEKIAHFSQESAVETLHSTGAILEANRIKQNWSIQQISEQLKLSQAQIIALEANQYHLLPALVIVRGFVRAYAKLLKIDADSLIALLPKEDNQKSFGESFKPPLSAPFVDSKFNLLGKNETNRFYIIGAIILILLVALFLLSQNTVIKNFIDSQMSASQQKNASTNDLNKVNVGANQQSAIVLANPINKVNGVNGVVESNGSQTGAINIIPNPASVDAAASMPSTLSTPAEKSISTAEQNPALTGAVSAIPATSTNQVTTVPATVDTSVINKNNDLILKFRENSWLQVKTEKGVVIAERLVKAGSEERFEVNQTLLVRIGNVAGVDASLRGTSLSLARSGGSNVANLSIK